MLFVAGDHEGGIVVLGPPTLLLTSIAFGLRAAGMPSEHRPLHPRRPVPEHNGGGAGVVLVDASRPGVSKVVATVVQAGWTVLLLGDGGGPERVAASIAAGAAGCLAPDVAFDHLLEVVAAVRAGRPVMTEEERAGWLAQDAAVRRTMDVLQRGFDLLTARERDVLRRLAAGRTPQEVATELFIALTTVRSHIRGILTKLGVNSHQAAGARWREYSHLVRRRH